MHGILNTDGGEQNEPSIVYVTDVIIISSWKVILYICEIASFLNMLGTIYCETSPLAYQTWRVFFIIMRIPQPFQLTDFVKDSYLSILRDSMRTDTPLYWHQHCNHTADDNLDTIIQMHNDFFTTLIKFVDSFIRLRLDKIGTNNLVC